MTLRPRGLSQPPQVEDQSLQQYLQEIKDAIDGLPFSYFSTAGGPNAALVSAPLGTLGIEIGSSVTKFWVKKEEDSLTTGWSYFSTIDTP